MVMLGGVIGVTLGWGLVVVPGVCGFRRYDCICNCIAVRILASIKFCRVSDSVSLFCNFNKLIEKRVRGDMRLDISLEFDIHGI